jgi:hypothetical protein
MVYLAKKIFIGHLKFLPILNCFGPTELHPILLIFLSHMIFFHLIYCIANAICNLHINLPINQQPYRVVCGICTYYIVQHHTHAWPILHPIDVFWVLGYSQILSVEEYIFSQFCSYLSEIIGIRYMTYIIYEIKYYDLSYIFVCILCAPAWLLMKS